MGPVIGRLWKHQLFEGVPELLRHTTVDAKVERIRQADAQIDEDNDWFDNRVVQELVNGGRCYV